MSRLFDAASSTFMKDNYDYYNRQGDFLEVLRGCGDAEVKYRRDDGWTVLMWMSRHHDWPKVAKRRRPRRSGRRGVRRDEQRAQRLAVRVQDRAAAARAIVPEDVAKADGEDDGGRRAGVRSSDSIAHREG